MKTESGAILREGRLIVDIDAIRNSLEAWKRDGHHRIRIPYDGGGTDLRRNSAVRSQWKRVGKRNKQKKISKGKTLTLHV